jgi:hypothetical protein
MKNEKKEERVELGWDRKKIGKKNCVAGGEGRWNIP